MASEKQKKHLEKIKGKGGRKKGGVNDTTKIKNAALNDFKEKVSKISGTLLMAQAQEAIGTRQIIRKDEIYDKKGKIVKVEFNVVEDPQEIESVLNDFQDIDGRGEVDGKYYMVTQDKPNYRASTALLDRALGRPTESIEHTGKDGQPLIIKLDS